MYMDDIGSYEITSNNSTPLMEREDIMPARLRNAYAKLPDDLKYTTEGELRKNPKVTILDERLRSAFWREVQIALNTKKAIQQNRIHCNICSETHFYRIVANPVKFAWITQPIMAYETRTEALLTLAVGRYEEILNMDIMTKKKVISGMDDNGKTEYEVKDVVDPFRAKLLMDTINKLEDRVKGVSVQRNITIHESTPKQIDSARSMDEINEQLKLLSDTVGSVNGELLDDKSSTKTDGKEAILTTGSTIEED